MFAVRMREVGGSIYDDDDVGPILLRLCLYFH